ncbi:hypothetical protein [Estrella lausannensis]|uniref:Uncharacterized protein n=1 Tax=Estrella lausannensis TaxID=483423 RepID=A0A0H5DQL9_9BACT|nr:hypothetical protein [Estrella lausannensis]CRX38837.1 hypothetical protein ELAC_1507 [Estrella lausannensis]
MNSVSFNFFSVNEVLNIAERKSVPLEPFALGVLKEMADSDGQINRFSLITQEADEMKFSLDLSSLDSLRFQEDHSQVRLGINNFTVATLVNLFGVVAEEAARRCMEQTGDKVRACISKIDLSRNMVSGKSLLWFKFIEGAEEASCGGLQTRVSLPILAQIEELKMDKTWVSSLGLKFACLLKKLKSLSLDFCPRVDSVLNPHVSSIPSLEALSIIGTTMSIGNEEMRNLAAKFPHLTSLEYSQKPSSSALPQKVLGITDPITLSTVIDPVLFECGHLTGRSEADQMGKCYSQCHSKVIGAFKPLLTRLEKIGDRWQVRLIDFKRRNLSGATFYHDRCGALFTSETVREIFDSFKSGESCQSGEELPLCPACIANPLTGMPVPMQLIKVYPEETPLSVDERSQSMATLYQQSEYIIC